MYETVHRDGSGASPARAVAQPAAPVVLVHVDNTPVVRDVTRGGVDLVLVGDHAVYGAVGGYPAVGPLTFKQVIAI